MPHFAHVDPNTNIVDMVTCITEQTLDIEGGWFVNGVKKPKSEWVQTSYNVSKDEYKGPGGGDLKDDKARKRKNFAGVGFTYDVARDAFIPPKPAIYPSWVLDEKTCTWVPPVAMPKDVLPAGQYHFWNEQLLAWEVITK